jgi:predicted HTH domain antitoxin
VRLALATALYRSESVSLARGARIAGMPLVDFMLHVSHEGIPVIRGNAKSLREDLENVEAWRANR